MLASLAVLLLASTPARTGDLEPLNDPMRPVTYISRDTVRLQWFTSKPCETMVQIRQGDVPIAAYRGDRQQAWRVEVEAQYRVAQGSREKTTWHEIEIKGLEPGKRYFYRVYDPHAEPTSQEALWGATKPWRREFAVSTQAPKGRKTIIRIPVKVLLMPNVINVESAYKDPAKPAPQPPKMTEADIQKIKDEFAVSSRFFWVNSGMRLWVDWQFFIDDRWQRWGPEPANADAIYKGWPASRSWAGVDYASPGGGDFTILDTKDPLRVTKDPVVEDRPYSGQVEMAWTRRWNPATGKWEFYNSGGGTYGVDAFPQGFPGRSQFLGGGDIAWLATHEFHHNLESHGQFALANREDERIVFNHPDPRRRNIKPDGTAEENAWTTSGRHGEHWDVMAFWDRVLSDAQWLRMYFGYTETVVDRDGDGFPDDDRRLPLDEKRFGSSSSKQATDGRMADLDKVMLSTWAHSPLHSSWNKAPFQAIKPNPTSRDTDGDGQDDVVDPYPLYPWEPFIVPMQASVDGDPSEWAAIPLSGQMSKGGIQATFKQSHSEAAYYGVLTLSGPWKRVIANFDGEGFGIYSQVGIQGIDAELVNGEVRVKPSFGNAPGLKWKAGTANGVTTIEFSFPNRGEGLWYWTRGGREIGAIISIADTENRMYSIYEPYRFFYARMLEPHGKTPLPPDAPQEIVAGPGVEVIKPTDPRLKGGAGWVTEGDTRRYPGQEESPLYLEGLALGDFDFLAVMEGKSDGVLGAFTAGNKEMNAGQDYIGFVGGYGNTVTRMRLFGQEVGDEGIVMTPGVHRVQLSRRGGSVWLLLDGQPLIYFPDPNPKAVIDRLAVIGGYGGNQVLHEIRIRR